MTVSTILAVVILACGVFETVRFETTVAGNAEVSAFTPLLENGKGAPSSTGPSLDPDYKAWLML